MVKNALSLIHSLNILTYTWQHASLSLTVHSTIAPLHIALNTQLTNKWAKVIPLQYYLSPNHLVHYQKIVYP